MSFKKFKFFLVLSLLIPSLGFSEAKQTDQAKDFVKKFYEVYLKQKGDLLTASLRNQKSSLSPELYALLREDVQANQKAKGEIVGLDFDPFLAGNDPGDIYKTNQIQTKPQSWWVQVLGFYKGQNTPCCEAWVEVVSEKGNLQISNIHYPEWGSIPENENLKSMLKSLAKERP